MCAVDGCGRLDGERPDHLGERLRGLRAELGLGPRRRERRRAEPEVTVAGGLEARREPLGALLRAPVLGEPPRELLGRDLGLELGELGVLLGEERLAPSARAAPRSARGTRRTRRGRAGRAPRGAARNAITISARSTSRSGSSSRRTSVSSRSNGPSNASRSRSSSPTVRAVPLIARQASPATGRGLSGRPSSAAPGRAGVAVSTLGGPSPPLPPRPITCHQMKNTVEPTKRIDRHPGVEPEPGDVVGRIDSQELLEEAAEAVVRDVEREERRRAERVAPVEPEEQRDAGEVPEELVEERRVVGGRSEVLRGDARLVERVDLRAPTGGASACRRAPGSTSCRCGRSPARAAAPARRRP